MTHPTWELPVENSALVLMPCPGTKEADLQSSLEQLKAQNVVAIVTAINSEEMANKNVAALGTISEELGISWFHMPIEDDCAPSDEFESKWPSVSPQLLALMADGGKIALHCMGGSGRTGLLAARLLLDKGWALPEVISQVQALRPGAFQKPIQIEYIEQFA